MAWSRPTDTHTHVPKPATVETRSSTITPSSNAVILIEAPSPCPRRRARCGSRLLHADEADPSPPLPPPPLPPAAHAARMRPIPSGGRSRTHAPMLRRGRVNTGRSALACSVLLIKLCQGVPVRSRPKAIDRLDRRGMTFAPSLGSISVASAARGDRRRASINDQRRPSLKPRVDLESASRSIRGMNRPTQGPGSFVRARACARAARHASDVALGLKSRRARLNSGDRGARCSRS